MLDAAFWRGRRVFLTGHTGFKGSWLSLWLREMGADLTGYAVAPPTVPSLFEQASVAKDMRSIEGDVRVFPRLLACLKEIRPEIILHMAAQSVVRRGYDDPIETYSTNIMGTVNLLEAVRQADRPCVVVNVTSDKCYENREWVWGYRENEPMGGHDPYSNSKGCSELVTAAFRDSYFPPEALAQHGVAVATARAGNAIGGGDWTASQLIPDLMRSFLAHRPCDIRCPAAIRPWQFVLEPLHGYLCLAERLAKDPKAAIGGWNFGPADGDAQPVAWIADRMVRSWGTGAAWQRDGATHPPEAHFLKLDASKARMHLGWRSVLPLDQALDWIVDWYQAFAKGADLRAFTIGQIHDYSERLHGSAEQAADQCSDRDRCVRPVA